MIEISQIKVPTDPATPRDETKLLRRLREKSAKRLRLSVQEIASLRILRHAIDARKKPALFDVYTAGVTLRKGISEEGTVRHARSKDVRVSPRKRYRFPETSLSAPYAPPVVVGTGPAGLFCALMLARSGLCPVVVERGRAVETRCADVTRFFQTGQPDPISNVQFGEGGAGTFSDGKLYTSARDRTGEMYHVLETFVSFGAKEEILYEANPHLGTDVLSGIVRGMREEILARGGRVLFETRMDDLLLVKTADGLHVRGIRCGGEEIEGCAVVMATGHSARDTYRMLYDRGVAMEPKPFAYGLRIAHPQALIDRAMYGLTKRQMLPAAPYKLTTVTETGRSVYTFCMCPGGYIINASSEEGALCVNGMSYSGRDADYANSAVIAAVNVADYTKGHVLDGMHLQRAIEEKAYLAGRGAVPVQTLGAYLKSSHDGGREGYVDLPQVKGRCAYADLREVLPAQTASDIAEGIRHFGRMLEGFDAPDSLLAGVETRTSAPLRVLRGQDGQSLNVKGLYPAGEGAGYAGGIMSAAVDGIRTAARIVRSLSCG